MKYKKLTPGAAYGKPKKKSGVKKKKRKTVAPRKRSR